MISDDLKNLDLQRAECVADDLSSSQSRFSR